MAGPVNDGESSLAVRTVDSNPKARKRISPRLPDGLDPVADHAPTQLERPREAVNDVGVKADAGNADEVPRQFFRGGRSATPDRFPQRDPPRLPGGEIARGAHRVVGEPQLFPDDVGGSARQDAERGVARHQSVEDFVDGPVAAAGQHQSFAFGHSGPSQVTRHSRAGRRCQLDVDPRLAQRLRGGADLPFTPRGVPASHGIVNQRCVLQRKEVLNDEL